MQASPVMYTLPVSPTNSGNKTFTWSGMAHRRENGIHQHSPGRNSYSARWMDRCAVPVLVISSSIAYRIVAPYPGFGKVAPDLAEGRKQSDRTPAHCTDMGTRQQNTICLCRKTGNIRR